MLSGGAALLRPENTASHSRARSRTQANCFDGAWCGAATTDGNREPAAGSAWLSHPGLVQRGRCGTRALMVHAGTVPLRPPSNAMAEPERIEEAAPVLAD